MIPDIKLKNIAASDGYIWGVTFGDTLVRSDTKLKDEWTPIANNFLCKKISAGSGEVWAILSDGNLYRMPEHGSKKMEFVMADVKNVSVASEFVWIIKNNNKLYFSRLEGFTTANLKNAYSLN